MSHSSLSFFYLYLLYNCDIDQPKMPSPKPSMPEKLFEELKRSKAVPLEDGQVWDAFRTGSEAALVYIYETNFDRLFAYGMRVAGNADLVEDAIQELFIDLVKHRGKINGTNSIKFYLFGCLKRKLQREASKWEHKRDELDAHPNFNFTLSHEQHLIDKQIDEEALVRLNEAVQKLSLRQKEMVYYYFYEDLDYPQIMDIMGFESLKSTRNLLYKALSSLRDAMG